ncbi:ribonuclease H-like [Daphnia pulicaria]|uniref:ribonuclease H-like n=1 Tax=Daphnia pulicaria TaxID=35523 RepID=UPI001EEAAE1B|nr:ribonuclease H-like [Daphnia pulicaria]
MTTFYAVVKGRKTGVFHTWEECESHVENFAGAHFQKFDSQEKAETFLKDSLLVDTKKNLYVVARGKIPGIYWEWSHAQKQLVGTPRNKYKKIDNLQDAELFYDDHRDK